MTKLAVKIPVMEYKRGWGSKVDDYMVCLTNEDANTFKVEFNSKNTDATTPDWYMVCDGNPQSVDLNDKQYRKLRKAKRIWWSVLKSV